MSSVPPVPAQTSNMIARITWVMVLRVLIVSALLGSTIILHLDATAGTDMSPRFLFAIIATTYAMTVVYALWHRWGKWLTLLGYLQLNVDAVLFILLVYATGGVSSGFTFLLHLWVIVAAISVGKRASYLQAAVSSFLLIVVAVFMSAGLLPVLSDQLVFMPGSSGTIYFLLVNVVSLFLVAVLVNILVDRIELAGEGLRREREEKKVLRVELEDARRMAALGRLAATLAHEIRNPLSAISGSFQMLREPLSKDADNAALAGIIEKELNRMGRLVNDILDYTRPAKPFKDRVDLHRLCDDVVRLVRSGLSDVDIVLRNDNASPVHVDVDANQLRQVLWNLLVNASQAVKVDGCIEVRIELADRKAVRVRVADNGTGVLPDNRERIFEPFFSTKDQGMGLGLALCRRVMESHGGSID